MAVGYLLRALRGPKIKMLAIGSQLVIVLKCYSTRGGGSQATLQRFICNHVYEYSLTAHFNAPLNYQILYLPLLLGHQPHQLFLANNISFARPNDEESSSEGLTPLHQHMKRLIFFFAVAKKRRSCHLNLASGFKTENFQEIVSAASSKNNYSSVQ